MAGLPCAVAAILGFALLGTVAGQGFRYECGNPKIPEVKKTSEKCDGTIETGSDMSNEERQASVNVVNLYRAMAAKECDELGGFGISARNSIKARYSCALEQQAKFECPDKADKFETSGNVWRKVGAKQDTSILYRFAPNVDEIDVDTNGKLADESAPGSDTVRLFLLQNAPEIGCYLKNCHRKEYIACIGADSLDVPKAQLLDEVHYGCRKNSECTVPGYDVCDIELGLCDKGLTKTTLKVTTKPTTEATTTTTTTKISTTSTTEATTTTTTTPKPTTKLTTKPTTAAITEETTETTPEVITEATTKPIMTTTPEVTTEATTKPIIATTTEEASETTPEVTTEATTKPVTEEITEPTPEITTEATTQPIKATTTEPTPEVTTEAPIPCENDTDCDFSYRCNNESRKCELKCTTTWYKLNICEFLRQCIKDADKPEDRHYCQSIVFLAVRDPVKGYYVVRFVGAAVSETRFLSAGTYVGKAIPSKDLDAYVIVGGGTKAIWIMPPYDKAFKSIAQNPDATAERIDGATIYKNNLYTKAAIWQDLTMWKLPNETSFKFSQYIKVNGTPHTGETVAHTMFITRTTAALGNITLDTDEEQCEPIFDIKYQYNKDDIGMACGGSVGKDTTSVRGVPFAELTAVAGQRTLLGIRSTEKTDRDRHDKNIVLKNAFVVTKLAPHCDWLFKVSNGDVKCV